MSRLPASYDVVVVGAGLAGLATAFELRKAGREVLVLERHAAPAGESSGRSASMVREHVDDEALAPWTARGAAMHRAGTLGPFRATGSMLLGLGDGADDDTDASARVPPARGRGRFFPGDGVASVDDLVESYLSGAKIAHGVVVGRIEAAAGGGADVVTDSSVVRARLVVNAAGAWAGVLGDLPVAPRKRHVFRLDGPPSDKAWPWTWDVAGGLYFRPDGPGRSRWIACACDERPSQPGDNAVEQDAGPALMEKMNRLQPGMGGMKIVSGWAGQRSFAPDGRFVVGWDRRVDGLFWVAGLGGHGITVAPAIGELAATMIAAGPDAEVPPDARPFDPARLVR